MSSAQTAQTARYDVSLAFDPSSDMIWYYISVQFSHGTVQTQAVSVCRVELNVPLDRHNAAFTPDTLARIQVLSICIQIQVARPGYSQTATCIWLIRSFWERVYPGSHLATALISSDPDSATITILSSTIACCSSARSNDHNVPYSQGRRQVTSVYQSIS